MLIFREQFIDSTVASVQSGLPCGKITRFIVDPASLAISLLVIEDLHETTYLLPSDIRYATAERIIIDAEEKLSESDDLLRHQELITQNFDPIGCTVVTESRKKLGKVTNYAIDDTSWQIAKLYVMAGILGNPLQQEQIIEVSDVVNVENKKITVRDLRNRVHKPLTIPLPKNVA